MFLLMSSEIDLPFNEFIFGIFLCVCLCEIVLEYLIKFSKVWYFPNSGFPLTFIHNYPLLSSVKSSLEKFIESIQDSLSGNLGSSLT